WAICHDWPFQVRTVAVTSCAAALPAEPARVAARSNERVVLRFILLPPWSIAQRFEELHQAQQRRGQGHEEERRHQEEHGRKEHLERCHVGLLLGPVPPL